MSDPRAFASFVNLERDALLAAWRRRCKAPSEARIDAVAVLASVVDALERAAADGPVSRRSPAARPCDAVAAPVGPWDARELGELLAGAVEEIGALRLCLHDLAAARGFALDGRALECVNRALDQVIEDTIRAGLGALRVETRHARDEQFAFVMHDLRVPLNAIALAADVLERVLAEQGADGLGQRMLRSVQRNVKQLSLLSEQALEASRAQAGNGVVPSRRPIELSPLVHEVVQELEPLASPSGTRLVNAVPAGLMVHADGELLARAFQNLVANAIDHAPGGEIEVGAESSSGAGAVVCWVRDDGVGIPVRSRTELFRKGASTRPPAALHGLGLPIVEQVIQAHGGRIAVESAEGFGATFWFELPALEGRAAASAEPS